MEENKKDAVSLLDIKEEMKLSGERAVIENLKRKGFPIASTQKHELINCLAYALRFWEKEPAYRLYYCSGHVINSHLPIKVEKEMLAQSVKPIWLPAEDYGYDYFISSFDGLLDEYETNLLKQYFKK